MPSPSSSFTLLLPVLFFFLLHHAHSTDSKHNHLVYWAPHHTCEKSMNQWLTTLSTHLSIPSHIRDPLNPYSLPSTFDSLLPESEPCSLVSAQLSVSSVFTRPDERQLGRVITSIREPFDHVCDKYFYRMNRPYVNESSVVGTRAARQFFLWFNDNNQCEQLRYYDGITGCALSDIPSRIQRIVDRIDCVVDAHDPHPDLERLCFMMGVQQSGCPTFKALQQGIYKDILENDRITNEMKRVLDVTKMLMEALREKLCRYLKDDIRDQGGWPFQGCSGKIAVDKGNGRSTATTMTIQLDSENAATARTREG